MSKQKHTPGPWTAMYRPKVGEWWIGMCPKEGSTTCGLKVSVFGPDESEANARLISAAPELLEELENAHTALLNGCETLDDRLGLIQSIETVIARAKGESND